MRKKEQQEIIQIMNILFFLTPKEDVAHVDEDDTMRQVLENSSISTYGTGITIACAIAFP